MAGNKIATQTRHKAATIRSEDSVSTAKQEDPIADVEVIATFKKMITSKTLEIQRTLNLARPDAYEAGGQKQKTIGQLKKEIITGLKDLAISVRSAEFGNQTDSKRLARVKSTE